MDIELHYNESNLAHAVERMRQAPSYPEHAERLQQEGVSDDAWLRAQVMQRFSEALQDGDVGELLSGALQVVFRGVGFVVAGPLDHSPRPALKVNVADASLPRVGEVPPKVEIAFWHYA